MSDAVSEHLSAPARALHRSWCAAAFRHAAGQSWRRRRSACRRREARNCEASTKQLSAACRKAAAHHERCKARAGCRSRELFRRAYRGLWTPCGLGWIGGRVGWTRRIQGRRERVCRESDRLRSRRTGHQVFGGKSGQEAIRRFHLWPYWFCAGCHRFLRIPSSHRRKGRGGEAKVSFFFLPSKAK